MRRYSALDPEARKSRKPSGEREALSSRTNDSDDLLLLLTVDLGNNHLEQLPVRLGDEPSALAKAFCAKHKLPLHLCEVLTETIETNTKQRKAQAVIEQSSGERTPTRATRVSQNGYSGVRPRQDFSRLQSVPDQTKSVRALVQRALNSKENVTPRPPSTGRNGSLKNLNHKRASSLAEQYGENLKETIKPTRDPTPQRPAAKSPIRRTLPPERPSAQVISQIKNHRYAEIFRAIKNPEDSVLRASRIRTDLVHSGLIDVITPLLDELRDLNETLTLEEFQASMENLVAVLTKSEKNVLFYPFEIGDETEVSECTFKPQKSSSHLRSVSTVL